MNAVTCAVNRIQGELANIALFAECCMSERCSALYTFLRKIAKSATAAAQNVRYMTPTPIK
jgi:hypothetical protein